MGRRDETGSDRCHARGWKRRKDRGSFRETARDAVRLRLECQRQPLEVRAGAAQQPCRVVDVAIAIVC